jgi:subtilisin-like proprotein convertase family protein
MFRLAVASATLSGVYAQTTFNGDGAGENSGNLDIDRDEEHVVCTCDPGYEPDATGDNCININPCTDGSNFCVNGECEDHEPPETDYQCNCYNGYAPQPGDYTCDPVPCDPVTIANSNTDEGITADPGSTHGVICHDGYGEEPTFDIVCQGVAVGESEWQDVLTCDPLACDPLDIENSSHNPSDDEFYTHDVTTVQCADGYLSSLGTCEFDMDCRAIAPGFVDWAISGEGVGQPTCNPVECPAASIAHSTFVADGEVTGDVTAVSCDSGYHVSLGYYAFDVSCVGADYCSTEWTGFEDCVPVPCGQLFVPYSEHANGYSSGLDTESAPLPVQCADGYQPATGDNDGCTVDRTCSPDGPGYASWTGDEQCVRKQCDPFTVVDGEGGSYAETIDGAGQQTVVYTCRDGFSPSVSGGGSFTATCDVISPCEVGWTGIEDCVCVDCVGLNIPDSDTSDATACAETSHPVRCADGFCAGGDGVFDVECTGSAPGVADWTGAETCVPVECGDISIANSDFSYAGEVTGDATDVECAAGYRVPGTMHDAVFTINCIPDSLCSSQWINIVECEPVPCDEVYIENSVDGTYNTGSDSTSSADYFTCAAGFEPSAEEGSCQVSRTCIPHSPGYSQWSGTGSCNRVICDPPTGEYYGTWSEETVDGVQIGQQTCESGYGTPSASFETVCVPTASCARDWDVTPDCHCLDCNPVLFSYSQYHYSEANACTEDTQVVDCDDGYCPSESGSDTFTIECSPVEPGAVQWTGLQECLPVSCGDISFANSDQEATTSGVTGDEFEVNCWDGYASGDCTAWMVQCVATGPCSSAWTHADLECVEEGYVPPAVFPETGECNEPNTETYLLEDPEEFEEGFVVEVPVTITCAGGVITEDNNPITEICLNIEHSYVDDLRIEMFCPNDLRSVILTAGRESTSGAYFGVACDESTGCNAGEHGEGWNYCFKDDVESGLESIWSAPTICDGNCYGPGVPGSCCAPEKYQIPSGSYQSIEHFTKFEGCTLDGVWTLHISDNRHVDDGYLYQVSIGVEEAVDTAPAVDTI